MSEWTVEQRVQQFKEGHNEEGCDAHLYLTTKWFTLNATKIQKEFNTKIQKNRNTKEQKEFLLRRFWPSSIKPQSCP